MPIDGLRKFYLCLLVVVASFAALPFGWLPPTVAAELIGFSLATYFGANVWTKFAPKESGNAAT